MNNYLLPTLQKKDQVSKFIFNKLKTLVTYLYFVLDKLPINEKQIIFIC